MSASVRDLQPDRALRIGVGMGVCRDGALFSSKVICFPNSSRFSFYSKRYAVAFFLAARLAIIFCRFLSRHV